VFKGTVNLHRLARGQLPRRDGGNEDGLAVVALEHPLLESFSWRDPNRVVLLCRERCVDPDSLADPPSSAQTDLIDAFCAAHSDWPLDHQRVTIDLKNRYITFHAGHGGVVPLYVWAVAGQVAFSWSITDLYQAVAFDQLDRDRVALLLTGTPPYGAKTVFRSVHMVSERASLRVDRSGATVHYPEPAPYYLPTPVDGEADIVGAACRLVGSLLQRWPTTRVRVGAEFSGGLDSAFIAASLADLVPSPLATYALQIAGPARAQQIRRRDLGIRRFGFDDTTLDVARVPAIPAGFNSRDSYDAAPYHADLQRTLRRLLSDYVGRTGVAAIATGTGGDELLMAHAFEQDADEQAENLSEAFLPRCLPAAMVGRTRAWLADYSAQCDRAPFTLLPISVLEAAAARAPLFIEHGLWALSPFAQPEAVRFYRSLPASRRRGKSLHRDVLRRLDYPDPFLVAPQRENFVVYLTSSLIEGSDAIANDLRRECRLHELGVIDADQLIRQLEEVADTTPISEISFLLQCFNAEWILRRIGARPEQTDAKGR
jgi:asparagine synthase (glutamine-hydrolysing)